MAPAQPSRRPRAAHRHDRWVPVHFNQTRDAAYDGKGIVAAAQRTLGWFKSLGNPRTADPAFLALFGG